jgi:ATP-dependent RNA helicase SUPV3L1/SUV3
MLAAGDYRHMRLLGAPDVLPLVRAAFPQVDVRHHARLAPLDFVGKRSITALEPGTVLVCFSRKAVLALASEVEQLRPGKVAALYGALPLGARRREIARFVSGAADVCVATDVLGHGVNLPCHTVLFAETSKFDGQARRRLDPWELAQIAGRAGRFGLSDRGEVEVLTGVAWASGEEQLVEGSLHPPLELEPGLAGYRRVEKGRLRPRLEELAVERADELPVALSAWQRAATRLVDDVSWLEIEPVDGALARLEQVRQGTNLAPLPIPYAWALAMAPVDPGSDGAMLRACSAAVADGSLNGRLRALLATDAGLLSLAEAEQLSRDASILRWFANTFPHVKGVTPESAGQLEGAGGRARRCAACRRAEGDGVRALRSLRRGDGPVVHLLRRLPPQRPQGRLR